MNNYEGPRNGDYVAYVDKLLRASPDFRRTQNSVAGAGQQVATTPGAQADSPAARLREKLSKARQEAAQAGRRQGEQKGSDWLPQPQGRAGAQAQERQRAADSPKSQPAGKKRSWFSPFSLGLIVVGAAISQFVPGFGAVLFIMGLMSAISSVLSRLKGK